MSIRLEIAPKAIEELIAAAIWHERQTGTSWTAFVSSIEESLERLRHVPESAPRFRHAPRARVLTLRKLRYQVFYEYLPDRIYVHAIAHVRRRPGYWLDRLT